MQGTAQLSATSRAVTFASAPLQKAEAEPAVLERQPSANSALRAQQAKEHDHAPAHDHALLVHAREHIRCGSSAQTTVCEQELLDASNFYVFRFLENYVSRLNSRLAQIQQEQGKKGYIDADLDAGSAAASQALGSGELKWDQVQPLLTEYDGMIYSLQAKLTERQDELGRFEVKLDDISTENAELVEKLKHALKEITTLVRWSTLSSVWSIVSGEGLILASISYM